MNAITPGLPRRPDAAAFAPAFGHADAGTDAPGWGDVESVDTGLDPGRADGWTPLRQQIFLRALSEGHTVDHACRFAGMSKQSAYAFRRRPQGQGFHIAWQAALLLARDVLADSLLDRALNGYRDITTLPSGDTIERHRHDNALAMKMLNRLDRMADAAAKEASHAAARLAACEFDAFLQAVERGPASAGMFLGTRAEEAREADLAPIRTLARADRWLRAHAGLAGDVAVDDLDPAARAGWTAEQWARAEAAGLVVLAPPPAPEPGPEPEAAPDADADDTPQTSQLRQPAAMVDPAAGEPFVDEPLWWDEDVDAYRTRFPPPAGFDGWSEGEAGEDDYERELAPDELAVVTALDRVERAARLAELAAERDRLFADFAASVAEAGGPQLPVARADAARG